MGERIHAGAGGDGRGMPTVSSGSEITTFGIIFGWKMIFFVCVSSSVMTPARPTSEPVPAVVGTATIGAMPSGSARVHQSPMSSKSQTGRVWPAMKAMSLPTIERRAAAEGDDAVMAAGAEGGDAGRRHWPRSGLGLTSENTPTADARRLRAVSSALCGDRQLARARHR